MKLHVPIPNTLFRVGLLLMIIKVLSSYSSILEVSDSVDMVISLAACLFFAGSILQKKYTGRTLLSFFLLIVLGLLTSVRTGNLMIFISIVTCAAMCGEDFDKTLHFLLFWEGLYVVVKAILSVILHAMGYSMLTNVSGEMMYNFGFSHPNVFACVAINLFAMYLWLHFDSVHAGGLIGISAATLVIYMLTGCRTAVIVIVFLVAGLLVFRRKKKTWWGLRAAAQYAVPVLSLMFWALCSVYTSGHPLVLLLDSLVSKRIKLGAYHLNHSGISLFGQNVMNIEVKWDPFWRLTQVTFDNIYTYLMVTQLIWLIILSVLFYKIAKRADNRTCLFVLVWALYGISEIHVINPYMLFVILLITTLAKKRR